MKIERMPPFYYNYVHLIASKIILKLRKAFNSLKLLPGKGVETNSFAHSPQHPHLAGSAHICLPRHNSKLVHSMAMVSLLFQHFRPAYLPRTAANRVEGLNAGPTSPATSYQLPATNYQLLQLKMQKCLRRPPISFAT